MRNFLIGLALLIAPLRADAAFHGSSSVSIARSEVSLSGPAAGTEYPFLNLMKDATPWGYSNNQGILQPDELDSNGYPLPGANWTTQNGAVANFNTPSQAERPGHYVVTWTGHGKLAIFIGGAVNTNISCTGSYSSGCDNTGCSSFTASISGTTLTVTAAPTGTGCTLGAGVPISGSGVSISTFGTATIITSAGSACGGNTCYTVNQSQSVGSETMQMGGRLELSTTDVVPGTAFWSILLTSSTIGNQASNFAVLHVGDESAYWASATPCGSGAACIIGTLFKTRIQQANFKVLRDLDWSLANVSTCTTWATRKPVLYVQWASDEYRNAASGPGQYVNASGTGASGGTVSYNAGTDVYSITLGAGGPVDKQNIQMLAPATGTTSSKISLNGTTAVPILGGNGIPLLADGGVYTPTSGINTVLIYDAVLGGFLSFGGNTVGNRGLNCGVPPEVFIEINKELKTTPWHVAPAMAVDPMTDWITQYATYIKTNYSSVVPIFEATNEAFNCFGVSNAFYLSAKSAVYVGEDAAWTTATPTCVTGGNVNSEVGKIASTIGQDLTTVYGTGNFELASPVQTVFGNSAPTQFNETLRSASYVNQTIAPTQSGYTQTPAYKYVTRTSIANYWNGTIEGSGTEVAAAYCYFNYSISSPCQGIYASQAAAMAVLTNSFAPEVTAIASIWAGWNAWATTCGGFGSRPSGCTVNAAFPLMQYEGGYAAQSTGDIQFSISAATNAAVAVLTVTGNGCVAGQAVALSALSGGTWSGAAGSYTVQASGTDANHCAINLNSTGLGTLSGGTLTYTGSGNYVTYLRSASYLEAALDTATGQIYNAVITNGGVNPSQYEMAANCCNAPWMVWSFDIYGYFTLGNCTACTISSTTLTLGGTVTGTFRIGDTLFGAGVTGVGTGAGSNTTITSCTPVGANACGTTSGDTLGLSQASTVAAGEAMTSNAAPTVNNAGNSTTSPVRAWGAICRWNSNGAQCNG